MSNIIKIKGKLTTGAPALGDLDIREVCVVIPDNNLYYKKDASTIVLLGGDSKANLASPTFTGTPTAPTPGGADNSTKIATTAFVQSLVSALGAGDMLKSVYDADNDGIVDVAEVAYDANSLGGTAASSYALKTYVDSAISSLVSSAPGALDTLNELAAALGDDPNFAATITSALAGKLDANSTIDGGTF